MTNAYGCLIILSNYLSGPERHGASRRSIRQRPAAKQARKGLLTLDHDSFVWGGFYENSLSVKGCFGGFHSSIRAWADCPAPWGCFRRGGLPHLGTSQRPKPPSSASSPRITDVCLFSQRSSSPPFVFAIASASPRLGRPRAKTKGGGPFVEPEPRSNRLLCPRQHVRLHLMVQPADKPVGHRRHHHVLLFAFEQ